MAVDAYVHHHLPGRLRLRIPAVRGEEDELRELSRHAAAHQRIGEVAHLRQRINTLVLPS